MRRPRRAFAALAVAVALAAPGAAVAAEPPPGPPQIATTWVTEVTATGARLRAQINPEGLSTTYRFEYLTKAAYEANLAAVPPREGFFGAAKAPLGGAAPIGAGTVAVAVTQHIGSLAPLSAYRYRAVATNSAGSTPGSEHVLTTEAPTSVWQLPDDRAWELVSPPEKGGGAIAAPGSLFGGGDLQAAAAGGAITYGSATSFGRAAGAPPASQYLSRRSASGWSSENVSAPLESAAYGDRPDGVPYRLFSTDLSAALLFGGEPCRGALPGCPAPNPVLAGSGAPPGYMAYYLRDSANGAFSSLLSAPDLAHTAVSPEHFAVSFAAASPDLAHVVLSSCAALTANAKESGGCGGQNLYEWSGGALKALNLLPGDTETAPGALLAAPIGAISDDGNRVYMFQLEDGPIYLREGTQSKAIAGTTGEAAEFQTASDNGRYAFYIQGGHLYRWDAESEASTDLTPSGGVQGVLGTSADGNYAYYQDATALKLWHSGTTTQIASGPKAAAPSDYPPATGTSRISADGAHLAFLSAAEIPPFDNTDAKSGLPDTELYLYGPPPRGGAAQLICASCNPTGERPQGPTSIPGALLNGSTLAYKPRVLTAGGNRVFFESTDELAIPDTNKDRDVYQWEAEGAGDCARAPGCIGLISSGRSSDGASFIDASANGSDVYFLTGESLIGTDPGSIDLYDARSGGGFAETPKPIACIADACQALPSPPDDPTPGTLTKNAGNPPLRYFKQKRKQTKKKHRHERKHGKPRRRARR